MREAYLIKERRVEPRICVKIPITFKVINDTKEIEKLITLKKGKKLHPALNISLGGMCLLTNQRLKDGSVLELEITIPGLAKDIKAAAEVVWSNETGGGIRFMTMEEEDVSFMKTYLSKASTSR